MQAGNAVVPPQPHPPESVSENDLKRRYLALLPPQQIIDICLNFELHVPQYVKHSIWPIDLKAAIAALQPKPPSEPVQTSNEPPMASLVRTEPASEKDSSEHQREPPKPPDPPQTTSEPTKNDVQPGSSSQQTNGNSSAPAQPAQPVQQPPYPQPYGYPPSAYPHSPYYPPPPNYPYLPHPYGYPPPGYAPGYPPHPPSHPSHPHQHPPAPTPSYGPGQLEGNVVTPDDLPSYEEMIVEALMDSNDPEGWMPKQLFAWMASHYPLQSNFRPSASQALQKAFKRGRLEKSGDGKYRLNATWEGGNTSRRTTRRPQTQNISAVPANQPPSSPFTHAPLVHHHHHQSSNSPAPQPGFPGFTPAQYQPQPAHPPQPQSQPQSAPSSSATTTVPSNDEIGEGSQAWEAAQTILKALNFNSLLSMNSEEGNGSARIATISHPPDDNPHSETASRLDNPVHDVNAPIMAGRASLQAQLALLSTQLAEIAQISVDELPPPPPPPPEPMFTATEATESVPPSHQAVDVQLSDDSDDDDMDEVTIL